MKLLFVHDHKFRKVGNAIYSTGGLNNEVLERYSKMVSQVTVIARILEEKQSENKWSKITNKKITIKKLSILAELAGYDYITPNVITKVELGIRFIPDYEVSVFAELLNTTPEDLLQKKNK